MLASVYRHRPPRSAGLSAFFSRYRASGLQTRGYAQQKTARAPRSTTQQQTTTNPSPKAQVKNRSLPSPSSSSSTVSGVKKKNGLVGVGKGISSVKGVGGAEADSEKAFAKLRQEEMMREMEETGDQLEMARLSHAMGMDPWSVKTALLDLRIPPKLTSYQAVKDNIQNNIQNMLSMFRLATDFAFPGIITKWRLSPQLFRAKSTSEKAWVAPFRRELLEVYKGINQAIASGDRKTLKALTAYEYQTHAHSLLQRNLQRKQQTGLTAHWSLHSLVSPVQILSLRAYPLYSAPEEPRYGNRNIIQALVRFESLQTLILRDEKGRIVKPDGKVIEKDEEKKVDWKPDPRRVLEYLICENKMFYPDGWYVRDQVFEGVKPKFHQPV